MDETRPDPATETAQALAAIAAEAEAFEAALGGDGVSVTDTVARWLAPRYAAAAHAQLDALTGAPRLRLLRDCVRDWDLLRRGDHAAARLRLDRERLAMEKEKSETALHARFEEWIADPAIRRRFDRQKLTAEERERRIRQIFNHSDSKPPGLSAEVLAEIEAKLKLL